MRKMKAGFVEQLDTKILIGLGILQNSGPEPHTAAQHIQKHAEGNTHNKICSAVVK